MFDVRDMSELTMIPKTEWKDTELAYIHQSFQQLTLYLNSEGTAIHQEVIKEIERRGGLFH
jgi:hypothetical protein